MSKEYVVLVDEDNAPIGTALKSDIHTGETPLHRAFSVFLFNTRGELLLQQRSAQKKTWPLVWSNSCCGHPQPGEETADAAQRRVREELGLVIANLTLALPDFRYRAELDGIVENEVCPVFIGFTDEDPHPNQEEVEAIRWIAWENFVKKTTQQNTPYSPWCIKQAAQLSQSKLLHELLHEHTAS